ncbi:MAG: response regulator, partial [Firmicutes bacterium]|nr:response regulator [Bacillota bacterium]
MAFKDRTILIVDDSEIDREILKDILSESFDILEAENGFIAIEMISANKNRIDAIMLDISMPHINGFDVLRLLRDNGYGSIPVFLITAEATRENVVRAAQFNISEFIGKPFDREDILQRIRSFLGISSQYWLVLEDYVQMNQYIDRLETFYKLYLNNFERNDLHYRRMTDLMRIMLNRYSFKHREADLDKDKIEIISKAAYFCDIGMIFVPDKMVVFSSMEPEKYDQLVKNHTKFGPAVIKLGDSKHCEFFISVCTDMCMNHHERYDGYGYPRGIGGRNLSVYSQMCRLADEFDNLFSKLYGGNEMQVNLVMKQVLKDQGAVSEELMAI